MPKIAPALAAVCVFLAGAASVSPPAVAQSAPRYEWTPGVCWVYDRAASITPESGPPARVEDRIRVWRLAADGGDRLVLIDLTRLIDGAVQPGHVAVVYADAAGQVRVPPESGARLLAAPELLHVIAPLPAATSEDAEWVSPPDFLGRRLRCGRDGGSATSPQYRFARHAPAGPLALYDESFDGRFTFDAADGRVARVEARRVDRVRGVTIEETIEFRDQLSHALDWARRRAEEAGKLLRAMSYEDRMLHDALSGESEGRGLGERFDRIWPTFRTQVDARGGSPLAPMVDSLAALGQRLRPQLEVRAALGARWMNKPAERWTLQTPTLETVTSETLRRDVVIEVYWTSTSIVSLHALSQLVELRHGALASEPVTVLAVNVDRDLVRGRAAAARLDGELTPLLGADVFGAERLAVVPLVRAIDRAGVVRGLWGGYLGETKWLVDLVRRLAGEAGPKHEPTPWPPP